MTITLSYDPTLARVVINLDDLVDGRVLVERSVNELLWTTVRGGTELPIQDGSAILYDYEFVPDVENFYRVTPTDPGPGLVLPGTAGAYAETSDHASLDLNGDLDIRGDITPETWLPTGTKTIAAKYFANTNNRSWRFALTAGGILALRWSTDGVDFPQSIATEPVPVADGDRLTVRATLRVDNGTGGRTVTFYTGNGVDGPWTQLGTAVTSSTPTSIFSSTADVSVGASNEGTSEIFEGTIHKIQIRDGIEGAEAGQSLKLNGVSGSRATAADSASLDIVGDLDLRAYVNLPDYSRTGATVYLVSKFYTTGNQRSYALRITDTGALNLIWSANGTASSPISSTALLSTVVDGGEPIAVRATLDVDNGAAGHTVTFYTAPTLAGPWTQLGTPVITGGVTSIFVSTSLLTVGNRQGGTMTDTVVGRIYAAEVLNGIAGTVVASPDFTAAGDGWVDGDDSSSAGHADGQGNVWILEVDAIVNSGGVVGNPDFSAQALGTTSFEDSVGRTWTMLGDAAISGTAETSSIIPVFGTDVWLKSIRYPFLNRPINCPNYGDVVRAFRGGIFDIKGRSVPVAVTDRRGSRRFTIQVITNTLEQARDMDLILAANQIMFIQVPAENPADCDRVSAVPGGYVAILETTERRALMGREIYLWTLPCQVVAMPGPDFVGTTLTWGTVHNLYGSWEQLVNSNPTWIDLFATVGSPEDLVVL